ncbi:MAG: geranylgeranylglycerol-phosphate geranylgeranyltransferase [Sulfolobales archaeon]
MSGFIWRLSGFVEILRIHNLLVSAMATFLGFNAVYVVVSNRASIDLASVIIPVITVILVAGGGYVINDYYDAEIDAINKPSRPIPSGRVNRNEALILSLILMIIGVILSLTIGLITFFYAIFNGLLLIAYSKELKKEGVIGNLAISVASANSIIFGGLALSEIYREITLVTYTLIPALYAFGFTFMREIIKGVEDVIGDSKRGVKTLATTKGVKYASQISLALMVFIVMFSPYPYLSNMYGITYLALVTVTDTLLLYSIIKLVRARSEPDIIKASASLRSYTKVAMFVGIMAFLADLLMKIYVEV